MPLVLREATLSDAAALTDVYMSAFSKDPISLLVFPRNSASWNWWYDSVIEEIADPNAHFKCIVNTESPEQTIIAYAKWNGPDATVAAADQLPSWPEGSDVTVANHFFGNLLGSHEKIMNERKHWYLEVICTRIEFWGRGAAGKLLRWGIEKADEYGLEAYLEASPDGKPIYEHFGFVEVDRLSVDLKGKIQGPLAEKVFVECFMVRSAIEKKK